MLLSFCLPAYNRPHLLAEAIASIRALRGSHEIEIIVCDDLGLPATAEVVRGCGDARISHFIHPSPVGAVENWNDCLRRARGEWVSVLHEDDLLFPDYLECVRPHLAGPAAAVAVKTLIGPMPPVPPPRPARPRCCEYPAVWFVKGAMAVFPGVMIRRAVLRETGLFDPDWGPMADYEFWYRLARHRGVRVVDAPLAFYRRSEGQWTQRAWPEMLRKGHLLRLRIASETLSSRGLARWLARFFTLRLARGYLPPEAAALAPGLVAQLERLRRLPLHHLPSGWVWAALRWLTAPGREPLAPATVNIRPAPAKIGGSFQVSRPARS